MILQQILRASNYKLNLFTAAEIEGLAGEVFLKTVRGKEIPHTLCAIRRKDIQLKPEEIVRQLYLRRLLADYGYAKERIAVEFPVKFGSETRKADIVIRDKDHKESAYIIVELKKPNLKDGKDQLKSYCHATGAPMGVWTNGGQISFYHRKDPNYFEELTDLPRSGETLADVLREDFRMSDLVRLWDARKEHKPLKTRILEMEDEVLANAGVDVFEEVFKLIFTKLYDELASTRDATRQLQFRNTGQTEAELYSKIQRLFESAKKKWEGIFTDSDKINLTRSHLSICVSSLQDEKLFNSNLEVIDNAFEYLVSKSSKGEKGQYFTPRYVIDMCVRMLDPQENEFLIDTAAGSSGFTVHSIFHVWRRIMQDEGRDISHLFTAERKGPRYEDYVHDKVFAIDFDEKSVRVGRTLNLIAGDGQTNYLHLNTLDYERWDETTHEQAWQDTYHEGFKKLRKLRRNGGGYQEFGFDVLMANPPFAGDIKESRLISKYDLARKPNGKTESAIGRDILFIERNLAFLKPGGRMAIVLPQGRFNNSSDKRIREYLAERCRILAVVGLHGNTFKPHTGTKTSVLLVQKWNDDERAGPLCPRVADYPIFFATQSRPAKDNSGHTLYATRSTIKYYEGPLGAGELTEYSREDFLARYGSLPSATLYQLSTGEIINGETIAERFGSTDALLTQYDPNAVNLRKPIEETHLLRDRWGHPIVDHDLFSTDGLTQDGIAEAFIEFAKKEKLSFASDFFV